MEAGEVWVGREVVGEVGCRASRQVGRQGAERCALQHLEMMENCL
jgi:hypothetical protein